jgi:hypothetical protein
MMILALRNECVPSCLSPPWRLEQESRKVENLEKLEIRRYGSHPVCLANDEQNYTGWRPIPLGSLSNLDGS